MLNRTTLFGIALAATIALAGNAATAQSPAPSQAPSSTTLTGCLYEEKSISGRTPNVAERAGVLEDYILVVANAATSTSGAAGSVGTSGTTSPMYKVELIADDKLQPLVGKSVEVTGKIDEDDAKEAASAPRRDQTPGSPDDIELPEFEASAIREVPGSCPATPAGK